MKLYRLLVAAIVISTSLGTRNEGRIYGGTPASPGQFPSIVFINGPKQFCDGIIINNKWVVTGAQCIQSLPMVIVTIVSGTHQTNSGGTTHNITNWLRHEHYNEFTLENDIGLIQIENEFVFDNLTQPIEFVEAQENSTCVLAGWGVTEYVDFPEELQYIEQTVLSNEICADVYGDFKEDQVCALGEEGTGACYGDSGSPLLCDGKMAGIMSYFVGKCDSGNPDFYMKATAYADWIEENIQTK